MTVARSWRIALLTAHIGSSVGWIGALAAYLAMDVVAASSSDAAIVRGAYLMMWQVTQSIITPLAVTAFATGVWVAASSKWGLVRHYWVLFSLGLTGIALAVLLATLSTVEGLAGAAAAADDETVVRLSNTLPHSIGGLVTLTLVLVLNVVKPKGRTPFS